MNKARGVCLILLVGLFAYANPTPSPPSDATATKRGLVNTTSQTFSGLKTFVDGGILADLRTGSTFEGSPILVGFSDGGSSFISSTVAAVNLFVDTTGDDSNSCTDAGVLACATIQGALNKLPKVLRHRVTVSVGSGSFTGPLVAGFRVEPLGALSGIVIQGTLVRSILASGNAVGVVESTTAASGTSFATVTADAGWTTDDLRNRFLVNDAGSIRVVSTNTNNVVTVVGTWSGVTGTTWEVMEPATIITTAPTATTGLASAGIQVFGNDAALTTAFRNLTISVPSATAPFLVVGPQVVSFTNVVFGNGYSANPTASLGSSVTISTAAFVSTNSPVTATTGASVSVTNAIATGTRGFQASERASITLTSLQINETSTNTSCMGVFSGGRLSASTIRCDCGSGVNGGAIVAGGSTSTVFAGTSEVLVTGPLDVTNCPYGVQAWNSLITFSTNTAFTGNALIYAAHSLYGGSIALSNTTPTITAVSGEVSVDSGATTGTFASIPSAFNCVSASATGSRVCRR